MAESPFARTYGVELLCSDRPTIDKRLLLSALRQRCPGVVPLDRNENGELLAFVHEDHPIQLTDARIAAQTFVAVNDKRVPSDAFSDALQQSWSFPEAGQALTRAHATVLVTDLMSSTLEYRTRLDLFQRALLGVLAVVPCEAIHWHASQRLVDPQVFRSASERAPADLFFAGAVNVRLFNIQDREGEMVMDTLGLAALGLPDLQCHFHSLEPNDIAPLLYNTAWYVFQEGDVIQDGHTLDGVNAERWHCQHEEALVPPQREVLDIDPGPAFAAGRRTRSAV